MTGMNTLRTPDFENFLAVLRREEPSRPTLFEFIANSKVMLGEEESTGSQDERMHQYLRCFFENGYDFACIPSWIADFMSFPKADQGHGESVSQNVGMIEDEESFENYPWPDPEAADYGKLAEWATMIPGQGKFILMTPGGILENLTDLIGFENLCFMLADEPELVEQIAAAIGTRLLRHYERQLEYDCVGACMVNDDWGFKTSTMLAPAQLREYVFPWHKKLVDLIHSTGRPAILHSCGNLEKVWDDIIDDLGYDGKHSYEDAILPVEDAYKQYGNRIAIMGGIDMDFLCRKTPDEVKARAKTLLEMSKGGYALGSGNSIAGYVPRENFIAMRDVVINHAV